MKKILLFLMTLCCSIVSMAQSFDVEKNAALQLVSASRTAIGLSADDLNNLTVSNSYVDKTIGVRYVYLQQTYKDVPVYNQIQVLAFKNNVLASNAGGRIADIESKVNVKSGMPSLTAESAVAAALASKGFTPSGIVSAISTKDMGRKVEFGKLGVSRENITAQLMWFPSDNGSLRLGWQVYFIPTTNSDYWLSQVDASNGSIIGADNLTVYCNWGNVRHQHVFGEEKNASLEKELFDFKNSSKSNSPSLADNGIYRVVPYPNENPWVLGGGSGNPQSAIVNNPWTNVPAAFANATTLKWHSDAVTGSDYNYTRGNNVWAYHDRNNQNSGDPARSATSTTALPNLSFDFQPNYTVAPTQTTPVPNQQFNTTNLFYINNVLHDILYTHGFDEVGGNFQANNLGRGGVGNDYVLGEAQDGSGTDNANFSTPVDGGNGRMQMYLWNFGGSNPQKDGDVDNGIVAHELGHGVSNRLFGGPGNSSCVGNGEHQGEGISDYIALMTTQNWAAANVNTGLVARGIGLYALNGTNLFGSSPPNTGIRHFPYSTDLAINGQKYLASLPTVVHDRGEYWCSAAWEATWAIIQQSGTIAPNIYYDGTSTAGNVVAMRIAMQAMKLAPCGSGFIDHRNGWLKADTLLYGGAYSCAIWEGFRKRGMGYFASQGSAGSAGDQTPDETAYSQVKLTASLTSVPAGQNITYTNAVTTCSRVAIANYSLQSTLPANVTFVSATNGGTYNNVTRVITWVVNQAASSTVNYQFTVNVNANAFPGNVVMPGCLYDNSATPRLFNCMSVTTPITAILAGCPTISAQPVNATICAASSQTFSVTANAANPITYAWQLSINGGTTWTPLANGAPYSGVATNTLTINPTAIGMNNYQYRCLLTTVDCTGGTTSAPATLTVVAASIGGTVSPSSGNVCGVTNSGTLTLTGNTGNVIRWESSINGGVTWLPIANTTNTLTFTNIAQTTLYRAVVQVNGCVAVNSTTATITFQASLPLTIQSDVNPVVICAGDPVRLTAGEGGLLTTGNNTTITISTGTAAPGNPYPSTLAVSGLAPSGVTVQSVTLKGVSHTWSGDLDIALTSPSGTSVMLLSDVGGSTDFVNNTIVFNDANPTLAFPAGAFPTGATLQTKPINTAGPDVFPAPGPASVAANPTIASFNGANFNGTWNLWVNDQATGDGGSIGGFDITFNQPFTATTGGTFLWTPAAGLNSTTTNPVAASPATTTTYTVNHDNGLGCIRQANILVTVNQRPLVATQPVDITSCAGSLATFSITATGAGPLTYQWQVSTNAGVTYTNLVDGTPYAGVTTSTLLINPTAVSMNNNRYRCVVGGLCSPVAGSTSTGAILKVNPLPVVTVTPAGPICGGLPGTNGTKLKASGANTYTWSPAAGLFTNANTTIPYVAGSNADSVWAAPNAFTIYTVSGTNATTGCVGTATVVVNYTPPAPSITPNPVSICVGNPTVAALLKKTASIKFSICGSPNLAVPDNSAAGVNTSLTVSGIPANAVILSASVKLNMSHTYPGDMIFNLKAPNGQILNLYKYNGGTFTGPASGVPTWGWYNASISSAGTANHSSVAVAPFIYGSSPVWKADALNGPVAGVTIQNPTGFVSAANTFSDLYSTPNGAWTLAMADGGAGDVGTLSSWCLDIVYSLGVPSTSPVWSPIAGLYSDAGATVPYVAGTAVDSVWVIPTAVGTTNYQATVQSLPVPNPSNTNSITIPSSGPGTPYPSAITVAGYPSTGVAVQNVVLNGVTHTWGSDIDVLLQSPTGQNVVLMSDVGGTVPVPNATYTFDDAAPAMNAGAANPTGSYKPTNNDITTDNWPAPGPGAFAQAAPALSLFGSTANVNGNWSLFVVDDTGGDQGSISGGWSIKFNYTFPSCTSTATTIPVTLNDSVRIVTNPPLTFAVCTDKATSISVAAVGTGLTYQWEVSPTNGVPFTPISNGGVYSGATTNTLTISAPPVGMSGYLYRCIVSGASPCGSKTSTPPSRLIVNPLPTVVISAIPYTKLFPGLTTTLTHTSSPAAASFVWKRNGAVVGGNTSTLPVNVDGLGDYTLTVTDVNGCVNSSNLVAITDSASGRVFIYPNPNSGVFQVRYYSGLNNANLPRGLNIYDDKGARVAIEQYVNSAPYSRMNVDLRKHGKGVYWVEVVDRNGDRLAVGRVVVL